MKALSLALCFAVTRATLAEDGTQSYIKSSTVEIHFGLASTSGAEVRGLKREDLIIEDNDRFYHALEIAPLAEPGHYVFVVDTSESLEDQFGAVQEAVITLAKHLGPLDTFSLISFDEYASLRIARTPDRIALQREFEVLGNLFRGRRKSLTSVEQALRMAILHKQASKNENQVIFLFSDGMSSAVDADPAGLSELIKRSGVIIHSIHFGGGQPTQASEAGFHRMQEWAELSGGRAFTSAHPREIAGIMEKVQMLILHRYRLRYSPDVKFNTGGLHVVKITDAQHADSQFSFVPYYLSGICTAHLDSPCPATLPELAGAGQVFPRPGTPMAPIRSPISDGFDFSKPDGNFNRLFARVAPTGLYNFYPKFVGPSTGRQESMQHLIQSRGIPNFSFIPPYTDYSRSFCVLGQDDSHPVQTPSVHWQRPFLGDEAFEVRLFPPEEYGETWRGDDGAAFIRLKSRLVSMRLVHVQDGVENERALIVNCHLPLGYETFPGNAGSKRWIRSPGDAAESTAFTWKSLSNILGGLFVFEVSRFP